MKIRVSKSALAALAACILSVPSLKAGEIAPVFRRADAPVSSLDPIQATSSSAGRPVCLVYETLLQYDYAARPYRLVPYAAETMPEFSPDGRTLTFRLRDDLFFGPDACFDTPDRRRKITSADVVFSWKRLADAKLTSGGRWIFAGLIEGFDEFYEASRDPKRPTDYTREIAGLQTPDEKTLVIRLTRPVPDFLWRLALPFGAIVPPEAVAAYGARFGQHEAGSGPFRLTDWKRGHRMRFERRPGRDSARDRTPVLEDWTGTVPYEAIEYWCMSDASTRWLSFLRGTFELATEISRDNWDAVLDENGALRPGLAQRGIRIAAQPALETYFIGFNMDDPVVGANVNLRRALSCAFDASTWVAFNRGRVVASDGPIPPGIANRLETPQPYGYDIERARQLLAEAGYPNGIDPATGRRLRLTLTLGKADQETREGAELIASFFSKIGIDLALDIQTFPHFIQSLAKRNTAIFLLSWIADYPDPLNFLQLFASQNASPGPNRVNFSDAQYDALYEEACATTDEQRRRTLCLEMQEIIRSQMPWIFLYHRREIVLLGPHLANFRLHDFPLGMEKHWRYKPGHP